MALATSLSTLAPKSQNKNLHRRGSLHRIRYQYGFVQSIAPVIWELGLMSVLTVNMYGAKDAKRQRFEGFGS